jgi:hypothetical protein
MSLTLFSTSQRAIYVFHYVRKRTTYERKLFIVATTNKTNSVALVRERILPTERSPLVGEVSADFCG